MILAAATTGAIDLQSLLWLGLLAAMLLACGCGFVAGLQVAPWFQRRAIMRAAAHLREMCKLTLDQLQQAERCCGELARFREPQITAGDLNHIKQSRGQLLKSLDEIIHFQTPPESSSHSLQESQPVKFEVTWPKTPVDAVTGLPDRAAFDAGLSLLTKANHAADEQSGLLLVRMDKCQQLQQRIGVEGLAKLQARLASVLIRAVRDDDFICRVGADLFAILLPQVDEETGTALAETVRDGVRQHRFRVDESGPEVLVTASFGYVVCGQHDTPSILLDRASNAVQKSQAFGRNQLHIHSNRLLELARV